MDLFSDVFGANMVWTCLGLDVFGANMVWTMVWTSDVFGANMVWTCLVMCLGQIWYGLV